MQFVTVIFMLPGGIKHDKIPRNESTQHAFAQVNDLILSQYMDIQ